MATIRCLRNSLSSANPAIRNIATKCVMPYLDIHTHIPVLEGEQTIPSWGLHPWHLTPAWEQELEELETQLAAYLGERRHAEQRGPTALVGECGLDSLCATPYPLQLAAFEAQIQLSERFELPLILHCVRAVDDVLRFRRGTTQPWIFHGFRGKPQQLRQLLDHGFYISFGFRHNTDSLRTCPSDRLFLETDDLPQPIASLYAAAAQLRGTSCLALSEQLWQNAEALFPAPSSSRDC